MLYGNKGTIKSSKQDLIKQHLPLVKKIAQTLNKKLHYLAELDDLIQCGLIGLLDALEKFQQTGAAQFETYASTRIYGAMVDELRKLDNLTQDDRSQLKKIDKAMSSLETRKGSAATDIEIAKECEMSVEQYHELLQLKTRSTLLSKDESEEMSAYVNERPSEAKTPEVTLEIKQIKYQIVDAIDTLPEREKILMSLYYDEEFTFKEIAGILELTEARVSQLHTQAINRLRTKMRR